MNIALGEHIIQLSAASFFAFNACFRPTVTEL
jgi:hypothetical protein